MTVQKYNNQTDDLYIAYRCVYGEYFNMANAVTIRIIMTESHTATIISFVDRIIGKLFNSVPDMSITLQKVYFRYFASRSGRKYKTVSRYISKKNRKHQNVSNETKMRVQRYSSDPEDAYVFVVWDNDIMHSYLDKHFAFKNQKIRGLYSIIFLIRYTPCKYVKQYISDVLIRLWEEFHMLNVIAQAPLSCIPRDIFIYKPFKLVAGINGVVNRYDISEIIQHPYLINNNLINLNGVLLKISIFERSLTAIPFIPDMYDNNIYYALKKRVGFGGIDGFVLSSFSEIMNFTAQIVEGDRDYGTVLEDGNVTGSLGQIVRGDVQFAANGRFIQDYGTERIEFTIPITTDKLCVIVPKSKRIPQWVIFFRCFSLPVWITLLGALVAATVVWYLSKFLDAHYRYDVSKAWLEVYSMFFSFPVKIHRRNSQILLLATCFWFNIIMMGIFQGSLFESFSEIKTYPDIDTLIDLDKSELKIHTSLRIFNGNESQLIQRLRNKVVINKSLHNILDLIASGAKIGGTERQSDAKVLLKTKYLGDNGEPLLHIVKECPISYSVAYIVPKGSAYLPRFNSILLQLLDGGFISKWYSDVVDTILLENQFKKTLIEPIQRAFNFYDLQSAFLILTLGCLISVAVFLGELYAFYRKQNIYSLGIVY